MSEEFSISYFLEQIDAVTSVLLVGPSWTENTNSCFFYLVYEISVTTIDFIKFDGNLD